MGRRKKDEYTAFYDEDLGFDPSEADESDDMEDEIEKLRGHVASGTCPYCGAQNGMKYEGNCYICSECDESLPEDTYLAWIAGYEISDVDDFDDDYDDVY